MKKKNKSGVRINGILYSYKEVGLEEVRDRDNVKKRYYDMTPLFIDCGKATLRIHKNIDELIRLQAIKDNVVVTYSKR